MRADTLISGDHPGLWVMAFHETPSTGSHVSETFANISVYAYDENPAPIADIGCSP